MYQMMKLLKPALLAIFLISSFIGRSQIIADPTAWTYEVKKVKDNDYKLIFHVKMGPEWHIWSLQPGGDGLQIVPEFNFDKNAAVTLKGKITEKGKKITGVVDGVDGAVSYFHDKVDYEQLVHVSGNVIIKGKQRYGVCNETMCLPPAKKAFTFEIKDAIAEALKPDSNLVATDNNPVKLDTPKVAATTEDTVKSANKPAASTGDSGTDSARAQGDGSLLKLFLLSLLGGFLAVLTPCVYSMIPITVSFFTKRSKTREQGIRNALYYALSIIIIFTVLGILISAVFGANALNWLSTNWVANLVFFAIFVIFGISFLGAFEITLPSSWTNKTDSKAGVGSFSGIFFMALTLVIVSFSCTGPIVGPLLVFAGKGGLLGPSIGMFGFSMGLALPFFLFAVFPGMLSKIATSGGWMNQVKVVLGFIELALALKFFSNADLQKGWRLLDREVFIALWIIIAVLLGLYLLGKLKLSHDDEPPKNLYGQEYVSILKLFLAIFSFTFAVYLLPGMWGAPLNGVSAFVPPMGTFDSFGGGGENTVASETGSTVKPEKYVEIFKIQEPRVVKSNGLVTFYDYDEALAASAKLKKPLFLDFTGINCANCRKMESQVWSDPQVLKLMKEEFVIASLYCDYDSKNLPDKEQYFSKFLNSQVETIGDKNEDLQATKFGSSGQPLYCFVDEKGEKLADKGYGYDPDIPKFIAHLKTVIENYKKTHP
jgi:thiol:disulfide interchange protein